jgi:hypothetical protein
MPSSTASCAPSPTTGGQPCAWHSRRRRRGQCTRRTPLWCAGRRRQPAPDCSVLWAMAACRCCRRRMRRRQRLPPTPLAGPGHERVCCRWPSPNTCGRRMSMLPSRQLPNLAAMRTQHPKMTACWQHGRTCICILGPGGTVACRFRSSPCRTHVSGACSCGLATLTRSMWLAKECARGCGAPPGRATATMPGREVVARSAAAVGMTAGPTADTSEVLAAQEAATAAATATAAKAAAAEAAPAAAAWRQLTSEQRRRVLPGQHRPRPWVGKAS